MTIVTKPIIGEKKDKNSGDVLIFVTNTRSKQGFAALPSDETGSTSATPQRRVPPPQSTRRIQTCLTLAILLALLVGFIGAIHVIKKIRGNEYYRGACRIPFSMPSGSSLLSSDSMITGHFSDDTVADGEVHGLKPVIEPELVGEQLELTETFKDDGTVEFDYELDLEFEEFESFEFPEISHGRFIHDFKFNKTAIIDPDGDRCFVLPLDRREVPAPRTVYEMIRNFRNGVYDLDIEEIRLDTRVVFPPLENLDQFGLFIKAACEEKTSFLLERVLVVKRFASEQDSNKFQFVEIAGKNVIEYNILNLGDI